MPELPEVETTLRGVAPYIKGQTISAVTVRQPKLRWPVEPKLAEILVGQQLQACRRRAKYLLFDFAAGVLIIHLGMSGSLRIFRNGAPPAGQHDHVDIAFEDGTLLRYRDPRRFGAVLWFPGVAETHPLLAHLGPEPLSADFDGDYLFTRLSRQSRPVKTALMDNAVVVGVGNIYANESLFQAAVSPLRAANSLTYAECKALAGAVRQVLQRAIETGGSTLRDFVDSEGKSGYFQQEYRVYGRGSQACFDCGREIVRTVLGQRATYYCPFCQH